MTKEDKSAEILSMRQIESLKYEIVFSANDGRHAFVLSRKAGSRFRKDNQEGDSGILTHSGRQLVSWRSTGDRIVTPRKVRPPSGFHAVRIFLSHSTKRQLDAKLVYDALADAGHRVWYDAYDMAPGGPLRKTIHDNIRSSDVFVPLLDNDYVASGWCREELEIAARAGVWVAPVSIEAEPIELDEASRALLKATLGDPLILRLRDGDAIHQLQRFTFNVGQGSRS